MNDSDQGPVPPYTLLAQGYDVVMEHVDYVMWAEYAFEILQHHHPAADEILELGCGTGSLALELQPLGAYDYHATDLSVEMLAVARSKAREKQVPISFDPLDFRGMPAEPQYDAILLLYDGINYVTEPAEISDILEDIYAALKPDGVFVFDQSTPANSLNHADGFDDAGRSGDFRYLRTSRYDEASQLHTTTFRLAVGGTTHAEEHIQRSYSLEEMEGLIGASAFELEASYHEFSLDPATAASERVHHVLRRPKRG